MSDIVSITSQGQISIPAKLRRELGLDKNKKAIVRREGEKIIVEPVKDFLELAGTYRHKAVKGKSLQDIIKIEKEAVAQGAVDRYLKSSK